MHTRTIKWLAELCTCHLLVQTRLVLLGTSHKLQTPHTFCALNLHVISSHLSFTWKFLYYHLFNNAFNSWLYGWTVGWMQIMKWNEMDTESGLDKIQGTILAYIWKHWGKPWTPFPQPGQPTSMSEPTNFVTQSTYCDVQCIHTNYGMCTHSYKK
jgi:hypothetical protein